MIFKFMSPRGLGTVIKVDYINETVEIENYTDDITDRAFGVKKNPTFADFQEFLESRCFPRTRDKMKLCLQRLGLDTYEPLSIVGKTEGRMAHDDNWLEIIEPEKEMER